MAFSCGFVGLPNVGKSTLFNSLTCGKAEAANFPFCTIEPNTGIVAVPDERLQILSTMHKSKKIVPATMKFIDIAGLVEGASKGQGLGNQFLGHIRGVDAVAHIVRLFSDPDVVHVAGETDPVRDMELILTELILADLEAVDRHVERLGKKARSGDKDTIKELKLAERIKELLDQGKIPRFEPDDDAAELVKTIGLISSLPAFVCANIDEASIANAEELIKSSGLGAFAASHGMDVIPVCAKLEEEINQLPLDERQAFLSELGLKQSGLGRVIQTGYRLLSYITFLTTGPDETRAWTVTAGTKAPQAAGKIHSDMERGFIRMEVTSYADIIQHGSEQEAKLAGKCRIEGKDYVMKDGDVVFVRFSV